ncbi:MAG TPA: carboxypeptidase-like regulatory domain-containing protein [Terriglobales bacterium]|nr:carboxypeptidase-like regulatory domain-containing protein [Terriglobales bacterium]
MMRTLYIPAVALALFGSSSADVHVFEPRQVRSVCGVVLAGGKAVAGAAVKLQSEKQDRIIAEAETDKEGRYLFKSISKGKYWVQIESPVGVGAVFVVLKKPSSSVCTELIETNIHPGQLPDDENSVVRNLSGDVHVDSKVEPSEIAIQRPLETPLPISECPGEEIQPNLVLNRPTRITGYLRDETTAPFRKSQMVLRKYKPPSTFADARTISTGEDGTFDFGVIEPGTYRLLASPHRGFAQPDKLDCYEQTDCKLDIVLVANPTDLPYAACPIK